MKTEILEKIEMLFSENAFAEVSMDDVAKKLDMKKASLYYHFSSKEQMFIEVLEYSFGKYQTYLEELLAHSELSSLLLWIIRYPVDSENLFSIVSQKGYCKIGSIRDLIVLKNKEIMKMLHTYLGGKYGFNQERTILLQSLLDDLSKKYCIFDCKETLDSNKLVPEIIKIFF